MTCPKWRRTLSTESGGGAEQGSKGAPLDLAGRSTAAETAPDRTHSQVEDGTSADRQGDGGTTEANDSKHASLANPDRFAGRNVCLESLVLLPGRQAPATCKCLAKLRNHELFRESFAREPSFRIFFRARFRAKACFTRRLSPGFR